MKIVMEGFICIGMWIYVYGILDVYVCVYKFMIY